MRGESLDDNLGHVKGIWYGNPKQGKTTALAGAARLGTLVAVDTEGEGWLAKPLRDHGIPVENIIKFRATSFADMEQIAFEIMGMFQEGEGPLAVAVDHMTDLEKRLLKDARDARVNKLRRPLEKKAATSEAAREALEDINPYANDRPDYGVWTNQAYHIMRLFRDLPCHVGFAAHYRTEGTVRVPALTEKFRLDFMGSANLILACHTMKVGDEMTYVATCREQDGWQGGDRFNVTRPVIVNPSFDRIIKASQGELDFATDPEQQAFKRLLSGE